jgi:cytochrome c-type biogenesis protein CcmH
MTFPIAAGLLLLLVIAVLLWALWRKPRASREEDMEGQMEAELSDDVAAGVLEAGELRAASADIEVDRDQFARGQKRGGVWVWSLVFLVVITGVLVYWQTGNWRAAIQGDRAAVLHRANDMLAQLQTHLNAHPDDEQGWITLGRAKSAMGDYESAADAYSHAVKLDNEQNPALLALWGEAQILQDPEHLTDREHAIFAVVLKTDPDSVRGLWYGGMLALHAGKRKLARARWQRLLKQDIPTPLATFVTSRLHALGAPATASQALDASTTPSISLTIEMAPETAARVKPGETLFIYALDADGGAPLAAKRVQPESFPVTLTLDGSDAMLKGHDLSSAIGKRIEIGAFLSADGKAAPASDAPKGTKTLHLAQGKQAVNLVLKAIAASKRKP